MPLSCKTPVCSRTLTMYMHFSRIMMITVKCGNVFWEIKKSILIVYWTIVFYVRCHPGIAQTLHGKLPQKLKDFCMYICKSCSMHFLTLSWPAGHICPTYKESFQVCWDNGIPLFLHAAIYLEASLFCWTSQNAFSHVQMILCAMLPCSIAHSIICTRLFHRKMLSDWFSHVQMILCVSRENAFWLVFPRTNDTVCSAAMQHCTQYHLYTAVSRENAFWLVFPCTNNTVCFAGKCILTGFPMYKWYCVQCCNAALHTVSFVHGCFMGKCIVGHICPAGHERVKTVE